MRLALCIVAGCLLTACGGAQTGGASDAPIEPGRYYPMDEHSVWSFDVDTGSGPPVLGKAEVLSVIGNRVVIENNDNETIEYERRPEGIMRTSDSTWIIRAPLEVGAEWPGPGGRTARIAAVDEEVSVFAGQFTGCLRIEETGGADGRTIATVYCPDVGPTILEAGMDAELTGMHAGVRATLRGFILGGL